MLGQLSGKNFSESSENEIDYEQMLEAERLSFERNDPENFEVLMEKLKKYNIAPEPIFETVAAILLLGDIAFVQRDDA